MLLEQEKIADETKLFLQRWGLKAKYVACMCQISEKVFSGFCNHKLALTANQLLRLKSYMADYESRNR